MEKRGKRKCEVLTWLSLPDVIYILRNTQSDSHRLQLYKAEPSEGRVYQEPGTGTGAHTMISHIQLIWPLAFCVAGISGDIIMSQSPLVLSVGLGQTATITCTASQGIDNNIAWYQQREGQKPSLLIYEAKDRFTGVSNRFTGSGSGTRFTLTISNVQNEDVADYYCQQYQSNPVHSDTEPYKNFKPHSTTSYTDTSHSYI
ncbi:hypothetical protein chiPu_0027171 [Chiloscyllium punctatum]|uniref:Ig-like domain-containing protein n=1 Tax=Chiloscyllium punctatum TaxID=137246 RepID=A0A401TK28_CHIPU|nr:hypothetical protein [Chiloscyllium punctatum]